MFCTDVSIMKTSILSAPRVPLALPQIQSPSPGLPSEPAVAGLTTGTPEGPGAFWCYASLLIGQCLCLAGY